MMIRNPTTTTISSSSSSIFLPPPPPLLLRHLFKPIISFPISLQPAPAPAPAPALAPALCAPPQIDMLPDPTTGVFLPRQQKVVVLWDLDNKPPRGPPYAAALALRRVAELFGRVDTISAYANRHAFTHLPGWVLHQRRQRRSLDALERRGLLPPEAPSSSPYVCSVCGRKCPTNLDLKKHFKTLHERERNKKLARMRQLRGKKRLRYRERFISGNVKYEEAARELITPKRGYGLAAELRRAGVFVKTVEDKPQAADWALKRQMQHSMARGIDWLLLVSDDSDFRDMIRRAREAELRTVVVGDGRNVLGREADLWVPWARVEGGEVGEEVLRSGRRGEFEEGEGEEGFLSARFYEGGGADEELEVAAEEIVGRSSDWFGGGRRRGRMSAFSEEDVEDDVFDMFGPGLPAQDFPSEGEEEEDDYYI